MKIIPIFLPYAGCRHKCVFCDQVGVTGEAKRPTPDEIDEKIREYLKTRSEYELAFYGGTFTGLPLEIQLEYLEAAERWLGRGVVRLRISTRPDEIDEELAKILWEKGVRVVEIGVQSMFDNVLEASKRGHTVEDVERAVGILKKTGFEVGVHLMVGLPRSSFEKDVESARRVAKLGVDTARIHPTLVFKGADLRKMFESGEYEPLSLEEAVERSSEMLIVLEAKGVRVIRIGLHVPQEQIEEIVAGPHHPSIGEMVRAKVVRKVVEKLKVSRICVDRRHEGWVFGYGNGDFFRRIGVDVIRSNEFTFDGLEYREALREYIEG